MDTTSLGRTLIVIALLLLLVGLWMAYGPRVPWLGRLPGDFVLRGSGWTVYLPLGTCLLISLILSLVSMLVRKK